MKNEYKISLDKNAKPFLIAVPRRIPLLEEELKQMEKQDIIRQSQSQLNGVLPLLLCQSQMAKQDCV